MITLYTDLSGGGHRHEALVRDADVVAGEALHQLHDLEAAHGLAAVEGVDIEKVFGLGALPLVANLQG